MNNDNNGHTLYTADDFTDEEIARGNMIAVKVLEDGLQHCKMCGAESTELNLESCETRQNRARFERESRQLHQSHVKVSGTRQTDMTLETIFTFGKHEGGQLEDVILDDPDHIEWLIQDGICTFDEEALELISKRGIG